MRTFPLAVFALVSSLALAAQAADKTPVASKGKAEPSADEIVERALSKGSVGFKQGAATLRMTIVTAKGDAKERTLDIKAMRGEDKLLKSMVKFSKPAEVAGTAFLVVEKKDALPDQYVYVPKAKVVRRIAAGNASSTFFGSDFTYGDLMPLPMSEKEKVKIEKLADTDVGGQPAYVIEVTPKIEGAPYGRVVAYVHKDLLVPLKIEFFGSDQKLLKTLRVKKLQKIENETVPVEVEMKAESGSSTQLVLEKVDPQAKLSDADFTEEAMQR
jgi:hypothetical protein